MKVALTAKGWDEVTTSHIVITKFAKNASHTVEFWNNFNKRNPRIGRSRQTCNCCKRSWGKLKGYVNLIFTNKGNKTVCDDCLIKLKEINDEKSKIQ